MKAKKVTLSVVLVAQNEERTIGRVLESVKPIADEIILVDSGSHDRTMEIARSFGAKVIEQPWLGYSGQKNFAINFATCDWVLSLDADEILTDGLRDEIAATIAGEVPPDVAGFKLPRVLFIGDTPVRRGGFYPDAQLRLFRKGMGRFRERIVHEAMEVDGKTITLQNDLDHYSYATVEKFAEAMDKYARLSAQHYLGTKPKYWRRSLINETFHPFWTFSYRYFIRLGFLDGPLCFRLNILYADYVRKKIKYLRELYSAQSNQAHAAPIPVGTRDPDPRPVGNTQVTVVGAMHASPEGTAQVSNKPASPQISNEARPTVVGAMHASPEGTAQVSNKPASQQISNEAHPTVVGAMRASPVGDAQESNEVKTASD